MAEASYFGTTEQSEEQELRWKSRFDISMDPREWMAKYGHQIICGDPRKYQFRDKELENWIHLAFGALINEGLEKLWNEFLTPEEIAIARDLYENP